MTGIGFYHLTRTTAEMALPPLLGRTLAAGQRALVRCGSAARMQSVDTALWQAPEPIWLPHAARGAADAALQPVWITDDTDCPNQARYLFLLDGLEAVDLDRFERVFDLFDGNDSEQVTAARRRWTQAKAGGHAPTLWRQEPQGWVRGG